MKSSAKNVKLASVDDLFSTEESRADEQREKVVEIPLSELHSFKNHPFKVKDDEAMMETAESIRQYGVLVPAIARPDPNGGYELVAGHRRHHASEIAGKETMPVIVRDLDDDAATIIMVDSNLQREELLPSERAFAYKMKLEAMKRQAGRPSKENCSQVGNDFGKKSSELLAEQVGQSKNQIFRYVRLTELISPLLDMVDEKKIALSPAYELSFLKPEEQAQLVDTMDYEQATPSLSQAQRLKKFSQEGKLTEDVMLHSSHHTIRKVQDAAKAAGISWPLEDDVTNEMLKEALFPEEGAATALYTQPDYPYIHKELARPGVNLTLLWTEYCRRCENDGTTPYMYTQFCEKYRQWARITKATLRIQHKPGGHAGGLGRQHAGYL